MNNYIKNLLKLCFVVLVFGAMLAIAIFMLVSPRPTHSDSEKRDLAAKPELSFVSLVTGKYFAELKDYYNDTVPNRESFKETGAAILTAAKGVAPDGIIIYNPVVSKPTEEPDDPADDTYTARPITTPVPFEFGDDETDAPEVTPSVTEAPTEEITATPVVTETPTEPAAETAGTATDGSTPVPTDVPTPTPTATPSPTPSPTPTPTKKPDPTKTPNTQPTPTPDPGGVIEEYPNDGAILYGDRGMELYGGSRSAMKRYVAAMEHIKDMCPDVNVYSMTVPVSSVFYLPPSYKSNETEQVNDLKYLEGLFSANNKVKVVSVYEALKAHVGENIYLRTDHHWTYLGAYYCMREFAAAAGVPYADLSEYQTKSREGFVGSMYSYFKMKALASKPETFVYYIYPRKVTVNYYDSKNFSRYKDVSGAYFEDLSVSQSYSIAMFYDNYLSIAVTGAGTGRSLLIIKDSFGNPTPSFLFSSFDKIIMIDPRYYTMDVYQLIRDHGITDVIGLANIFSHTTTSFVRLYEDVAQNR